MPQQTDETRERHVPTPATTVRGSARYAACGLVMGSADIIPGVSGGTMALILGIYARLVTAISRLDTAFIKLLAARRWRVAWQRVDGGFLLPLGAGIALGILSLAKLMRFLLEQYHSQTLAVFFGLILGSSWLVARQIKLPRHASVGLLWALGAVAALAAWWVVALPQLAPAGESVGPGYVFVCGMVAICAMILPGVSGAYFLLILGLYYHVTDIIHRVTSFDASLHDWATVATFGAGCCIGLLGFSRVLRWLLTRFEMQTMAVLCGLMIGSLRRVWPFQVDTTPDAEFKQKVYEAVWPGDLSSHVWAAAALAAAAAAAVVLLEYVAHRRASSTSSPRELSGQSLGSPAE